MHTRFTTARCSSPTAAPVWRNRSALRWTGSPSISWNGVAREVARPHVRCAATGARRAAAAATLPRARHTPRADAAEHRVARQAGTNDPPLRRGRGLPRHPDADPVQADTGGRARLRRPEPAATGSLLRIAPVAADP